MADPAPGDGLAGAVHGVDAVVHLASAPGRGSAQPDVAATRRLVAAAHRAGVRHLVYVSIVGVDRVPLAYYRAKLAAEGVVRAGPVPFTMLARRWQQAGGRSRPVLPVRIPGRIGRELRAGALTTAAQPAGSITWDDYLAARFGRSRPGLGGLPM